MKKVLWGIALAVFAVSGCQTEYKGIPENYHSLLDSAFANAGQNTGELETVLQRVKKDRKEAAAFLLAYMPEKDLKSLSSDFILDQLTGSFKAREEFV